MLEPGKVRAEYHTKVFVSVFGLNWTTIQVVQVTIILTDRGYVRVTSYEFTSCTDFRSRDRDLRTCILTYKI